VRVLILCAHADDPRWGDYLGVPRHLAPLCGEPILHRTVRMVHEYAPGAQVRVVVDDPRDDRYAVKGTRRVTARTNPGHGDAGKFLATAHLWGDDRTVILLGDVWWHHDTLRALLEHQDGWHAMLRIPTHGHGGELFGFTFPTSMRDQVVTAAETFRGLDVRGEWGVYRVLNGKAPTDHAHHGHATDTVRDLGDEWTDDMDSPHDWERWCYRWATTSEQERPA
jgi:CTP:molybdopterin cytidylyltransferase MocA